MTVRLPLETQTLHVELLEHLLTVEAERSLGTLTGAFTTKDVKGAKYLYFQESLPGGKTRQFYLGRKPELLEKLVTRAAKERKALVPDRERSVRLATQLRAGGATMADAATARVVQGLADAGLFHAGAVLVGTHALPVLGNLLGVRWAAANLRTQDVDLGSTRDPDIDLVVTDATLDVPAVLDSLKMGLGSTRGVRRPRSRFAASHCAWTYCARNGAMTIRRSSSPASAPPLNRWPSSTTSWRLRNAASS